MTINITQSIKTVNLRRLNAKLVLYVLDKATGIAKERSISKISVVMNSHDCVAGKFKIMRSGPKTLTVV